MGGARWEGDGVPRFQNFTYDEQRRMWNSLQGDARQKAVAMAWARSLDPRWFNVQVDQLLAETLIAAPKLAAVAPMAVAVRPETQAMVYRALREQAMWDLYFKEAGDGQG